MMPKSRYILYLGTPRISYGFGSYDVLLLFEWV